MPNHSVLIVGESSQLRENLVKTLKTTEIKIDCVSGSSEAEAVLFDKTNNIGAIILAGPKWSEQSLTFLKSKKDDPIRKHLPVIGFVNDEHSTEKLEDLIGAKIQFLTMADRRRSVISVIESSIDSFAHCKELLTELGDRTSAIGLIKSGIFEVRTPKEADGLTTLLSLACPDPASVALGIQELIINAIEHGNLNIGYDLKTQLLESGTWQEEIQARLVSDKYKDRVVTVHFMRREKSISITFSDQGEGFDWRKYSGPQPTDPYILHGRGILYASSIDGAVIEYKGDGSEVELTLNIKNQ